MHSGVFVLNKLLAVGLQSFCSKAQGSQEPPKGLVLLQQALGLPHIFLGYRYLKSGLGGWGQDHLTHHGPRGLLPSLASGPKEMSSLQ